MTSPVVVITGSSGGLGQALVESFQSSGWQVVAAARSPQAASESVIPVQLDVTSAENVPRAFDEIAEHCGRIDALINNAGVTADALCAQMTEPAWDRVLDVNLRGAFLCARAASRVMLRQRDGHIINISSFAARSGPKGQANYAAAKAGLIGLTQSLARELGPRNVRSNAVLPGVLPTAMTRHFTAEQLDAFARGNALGRINSLDEVARFIAFLASTKNISGQVFQLDSRIAPWC
jgi:3-oxoacyl-[acyl-carrier protein] reductase